MSSQEAFLSRVRRALRKESVPAAVRLPLLAPGDDLQAARASLQTRLRQQRPGLIAQLQRELTAAGGVVSHLASVAEATRYITQVVQEKQVSLMVRWPSAFLRSLEVEATLQAAGMSVQVVEAAVDTPTDTSTPEAQARPATGAARPLSTGRCGSLWARLCHCRNRYAGALCSSWTNAWGVPPAAGAYRRGAHGTNCRHPGGLPSAAASRGYRRTTPRDQLRLLYHRPQPHGRHRADADSGRSWPQGITSGTY